MNCSECRELWSAFERANTRFHDALHASFYQISQQIAAHEYVVLQRAKNDLEEHHQVCPWAKLVDDLIGTSRTAKACCLRYVTAPGEC